MKRNALLLSWLAFSGQGGRHVTALEPKISPWCREKGDSRKNAGSTIGCKSTPREDHQHSEEQWRPSRHFTIPSPVRALARILFMSGAEAGWQVSSAQQGQRPAPGRSGHARSHPVVLMPKAKTKKKPAQKSSKAGSGGFGSSGGGFGAAKAVKTKITTEITLPGASPELEMALSSKAKALIDSPKDPQAWLQLGAVLVKSREYAEAERIFRAGAALAPDNEMLCGAAVTFGGDSSAYYHGEPKERPSKLSASALPALDEKLADAGFDGYMVPPEHIFANDQADRAIDWTNSKTDVMTRGAVFRSKGPLLSPSECAWVIEQVEKHAEESGGWTTARHVDAPTTDVPVSKVPAIREWFDKQLRDVLFPMLHARYPELIAGPHELRVMDAFVVRYDAREQASLPVHQDENVFSFTIALNDRSEYEGGGTSFERLRAVGDHLGDFSPATLNVDAGSVVTFAGKLRHAGNTVTKGRRYIIPLFIYADVNLSGKKPGYVMEQLNLPAPSPEAAAALSKHTARLDSR